MKCLKDKYYRSKLIFLLSVILPCTSFSQVTIGALDEPHPSAVLELKTSDKGFLGPRVALTDIWDKTTVPNYTDGLLVFNINDSNTEVAVGDRVVANKYYYWSTDRWIQVVGKQTMVQNIEQALANLGIPRPAIFSLNGKQHIFTHRPVSEKDAIYPDMLGVINPLEGIFPTSNPNYTYLPLKERVNYTSGTVKLDSTIISGGKKKFFLTFQPGIYSIIFTYEFIPADTAGSQYSPGHDACYSATYFMQFPVNIKNDDGTISSGLTRIESNCYHGPGAVPPIFKEGRYADHGNTISYVAVLLTETVWDFAFGTGYGDDNCNGKAGLSMPNRSTFLYISRLGDPE